MIQSVEISSFIKGWALRKYDQLWEWFSTPGLTINLGEFFLIKKFKSKRFPGCHCENQLLSCRKHKWNSCWIVRERNVILFWIWVHVKHTQFTDLTLQSMQSADSWFPWRNCRKVNHSSGTLSFLVPSFLSTTFSGEGENYSGAGAAFNLVLKLSLMSRNVGYWDSMLFMNKHHKVSFSYSYLTELFAFW